MLAFGDVETIHREDTLYWRIVRNRQVDDLAVQLIDLLISIRYAHPAIVQLELALSESEGMSVGDKNLQVGQRGYVGLV
jgi:hypothetical protein